MNKEDMNIHRPWFGRAFKLILKSSWGYERSGCTLSTVVLSIHIDQLHIAVRC
jgi:hypothetical protein